MLVRAKNNGGEWTGALLQTLEETLRMEKYENIKKKHCWLYAVRLKLK